MRLFRPDRRSPAVEALEPRLLHSGDGVGAAVGEAAAAFAWTPAAQAWVSAPPVQAGDAAGRSTGVSGVAPGAGELVVVDARVPDAQRLIAGFEAQREAGRALRVVVVQADEDGVSAIESALGDAGSDWRAVHLVGHGEAGELRLGSTRIDAALLRARAGEIAQWSTRLGEDADLLLWGCGSGAGEAGAALLDGLAALTGADVAASDDATGGLAAGGDWALEVSRGHVETAAPIDAALQASYDGLLAITPAGASAVVNGAQPVISPDGSEGSVPGRQVAAGAAGTVTVWVEAGDDDGDTRIVGRFDPAAGGTGAAFRISGDGQALRGVPSVAVDDAGYAFVAWRFGDSVQVAYYAPPSSAGGVMRQIDLERADVDIEDSTRGDVSVAMSPNGRRAAVTWIVASGDAYSDVQLRRYTLAPQTEPSASALQTLDPGGPVKVTDRQGLPDFDADVAIRDDGSGLSVFHTGISVGAPDPLPGVFTVPFDTNGIVPASRPDTNTGVRLVPYDAAAQVRHANIAMDAQGNALAVWIETRGETNTLQAVALDAAGRPVGSVIALETGAAVRQPSVSAIGSGRFAVAWTSAAMQGGSGLDIALVEVQVASGGGATVDGTPILVNTATSGSQVGPSVAAGGGRIVVAWTDLQGQDQLKYRSFVASSWVPQITLAGPVWAVDEGGASVLEVDVRLSAPPAAPTTVVLSLSRVGQATLSATVLQFDPGNWDRPQRVTLAAIDDAIADGDVAVQLLATADVGAAGSATFTVRDNDAASVFVVTTTQDVDDTGGGTLTPLALYEHQVAGNAVSLREALRAANADGGTAAARDLIRFALPGGVGRIVVSGTTLPRIVSAVDIDGGPYVAGAPRIELVRGSGVGSGEDGLVLDAGSAGSRIARLAVGGFGDGISIRSAGNVVEGNWLGVGRDGVVDSGASFANRFRGVEITDAGATVSLVDNVIRDNRIANNREGGIRVLGSQADGTVIIGNTIEGNGLAGGAADGGYGIKLTNNADWARVGGDPLVDPGAGNVILGNGAQGILVASDSRFNRIFGNTIGGQPTPLRIDATTGMPSAPTLSGARVVVDAEGVSVTVVELSVAAEAGQQVRIDVYGGRTAAEAIWLASRMVVADANGRASGGLQLPAQAGEGSVLTATATRMVPSPGTGVPMRISTSALSAGVQVDPPAPVAAELPQAKPQQAKPQQTALPQAAMRSASLSIDSVGSASIGDAAGLSVSSTVGGSTAVGAAATPQGVTVSAALAAGEAAVRAAASSASAASASAASAASATSATSAASATSATSASTSAPASASAASAVAPRVAGVTLGANPGLAGLPGAPQTGSIAIASAAGVTGEVPGFVPGERGLERAETARGSGGATAFDAGGQARAPASTALGDLQRRGGVLAPGLERSVEAAAAAAAWSPAAALQADGYAEAMRQTREEAGARFETRTVLVTSTVMLSTSLSIGYAVWMARGGVLLTSLLASMPAWRSIDPLPVLSRVDARGRDDAGEDDSLKGLLARAAERAVETSSQPGVDAHAATDPAPALRPGPAVA